MPAASKQQQKLMGIVHALQKGDMKPSQASGKAKEMAKSMKKGDVKDFASTKHKGLPKKVKKEDYDPTKMYVVLKPMDNLDAAGLIKELNPLEGLQPLNIMQDDVHSVVTDESEAQRIAAEVYDNYCKEVQALEEKKGKVGDKLKKTIDQLEKKRKQHVDMAKEDPKNASQHKEHIAKIASQIDDLMSKMEKIEKSKKNIEKEEDKKKDKLEEDINAAAPGNEKPATTTSDVKNIVKYIETKSDFISRLEKVSNGQEVTEFLSFILNKINPKVSGVNKNALMNIIKDRFK